MQHAPARPRHQREHRGGEARRFRAAQSPGHHRVRRHDGQASAAATAAAVPLAVPLVVMKMRRASAVALLVMKGAACRLPSLGIERRRRRRREEAAEHWHWREPRHRLGVLPGLRRVCVRHEARRCRAAQPPGHHGVRRHDGQADGKKQPSTAAVRSRCGGVRQSSRARRVKEGRHGAAARRTCSVHHEETKALHPLGAALALTTEDVLS